MADISVEEQLKKYPYLQAMTDRKFFITEEEYKTIDKSEIIKIGNENVRILFLEKILKDPQFFEYAVKFFKGEKSGFSITYIYNGDTLGNISYDKSTIIVGIEQLISTGKLKLTDEEKTKLEMLKNNVTFDSFVNKYENDTYELEVDDKKYTVLVKDIIALMQMPDNEFDRLCSDDKIKDYKGIPKEYFIYISYYYFQKNDFTKNYMFPITILQKYYEIGTLQKIDIQAINRHLKTEDSMFNKFEINPELEQAIMSGLPVDASDLEKAIYIYIKMCKVLTYDQEYYAVNQKGTATLKHQDISFASTITPDNNEVVCFEFNLIYSKLLDKLGIKFRSDYKNMVGESYGGAHANLEFRCGKYLVSADSVTSILQGDIMQAKLNQPLVGLKCLNVNSKSQKEFKEMVQRVYNLVAEQDKRMVGQVNNTEKFDDLLAEYSSVTSNIKEVGFDEKLTILGDKIKKMGMVGIDTLSYLLQLRKVLFTEQERENKIKISVVRNNKPEREDKLASATAIIALNKEGFEEEDKTIYYYLNQNNELVMIDKDEIQKMFDNKDLEYIEKDDPRIPGINEGVGVRM